MHVDREAPVLLATKGLFAGMSGTVVLMVLVAVARTLLGAQQEKPEPEVLRPGLSAGQALAEGPGMPPNMNRVTVTFVQKIATGIFGISLNPDQQYVAGMAWHLTYGDG